MRKFIIIMLVISIFMTGNLSAMATGLRKVPSVQTEVQGKNKYVAAGLAVIMFHQFYLGNTKTGLLYWVALLVVGMGYVLAILDVFALLFMDDETFQRFMDPENMNTVPLFFALFDGWWDE